MLWCKRRFSGGLMKKLIWVLVPFMLLAGTAWAEAPPHQSISANCRAFYPQSAWEKGLKGNVSVAFQVNADGRAKDITVLHSSGITALDEAATACISASRYEIAPDAMAERSWQENVDFFTLGWWTGRPHHCDGYRPKDNKEQGVTKLLFTIGVDGHTADAKLDQSTASAALNEASLTCLSYWRYKPAVKDGQPIAVPWVAFIIWGDVLPPPVTGDAECWKALWPKPEDAAGVTGPTVVSMISARDGTLSDLHVKSSSGVAALDRIALTCISRPSNMMQRAETVTEQPGYFRHEAAIDWHKKLVP